jgi:hypothetical protein
MTETVYSHRPAAGVSVAAKNANSRLIVAFALVNDGTSRNGVFWSDRHDAFSRPTARQILNGRIEAAQNAPGIDVPMTVVFETDLSARKFMAAFRGVFKPTLDETDEVFSIVEDWGIGDLRFRYRERAENILEKLFTMANEVVADASARI